MILGICGLAGSGKDTAAKTIITDYRFVPMAFADEMKRTCKRIYEFTDDQLWGPSSSRNAPDKRYPRSSHTWLKLPNREKKLDDGTPFVEDNWHGCACCGQEAKTIRQWADDRDESWVIDTAGIEPCYLTTRYALQQLGTGWGRDCYGDTWVMVTLRAARRLLGMDAGDPAGYQYDQKLGLVSNVTSLSVPRMIPGVVLADLRYLNEIRAVKAAGGRVLRIVRPGAGLHGGAAQHTSETEQATLPDNEFDAVIHNDDTLEALNNMVLQTALRLGVK